MTLVKPRWVHVPWIIGGGVLLVVLLASVLLPLATGMFDRWTQRDVDLRSRLVFESIREQVADFAAAGDTARANALFDRLTTDQRLVAAGLCAPDAKMFRAVSFCRFGLSFVPRVSGGLPCPECQARVRRMRARARQAWHTR